MMLRVKAAGVVVAISLIYWGLFTSLQEGLADVYCSARERVATAVWVDHIAACAPQPRTPSSPTAPSARLPALAAAPPAIAAASPAPAAVPSVPVGAPSMPAASPAPAAAPAAAPAIPASLPRGTVNHVVDGGTVDVDLAGTVERIRHISTLLS